MSKKLGNVVDPWDVIARHGADAFRWYFLTSTQPWDGYLFNADTIGESLRQFLLQLWNTYGFYVLYANVNGIDEGDRRRAGQRPRSLGALAAVGDGHDGHRAAGRLRRHTRRARDRGVRRRSLELVRAPLPAALLGWRSGGVRDVADLPGDRDQAAGAVRAVHGGRDLRQPRRQRAVGAPVRLADSGRARRGARVRDGDGARDGPPRSGRARPGEAQGAPAAAGRGRRGGGGRARGDRAARGRRAGGAQRQGAAVRLAGGRARLLRGQAELPGAGSALRQADAAGGGGGRRAGPGARGLRAARRGARRRSTSTATITSSTPTT